jgi:hypothetical protein
MKLFHALGNISDIATLPDHDMVITQRPQLPIAAPAVRAHGTSWFHHYGNCPVKVFGRGIGNPAQANPTYMAFFGLGCDYRQRLSGGASSTFTRFFTADVRLIHFDLYYDRSVGIEILLASGVDTDTLGKLLRWQNGVQIPG